MTRLFDRITRLSLRFYWLVILLSLLVLGAGIWAATQLNMELIPRVEFPQTIVVAQWPDSEDAETFLEEITLPLEAGLATVNGVVNVESTTNAGFAFIIVRNEFGLNQANVLAEIETAVDAIPLPDKAETQVLNFSFSDLPIVVASASSGDISLPELKALAEAEIQPRLERIEQVSRVSVSGGQELPEEEIAAAPTNPPQPTPTAMPTETPAPTETPPPTLGDEIAVAEPAEPATNPEPSLPEIPAVPLPQSWIVGAAEMGQPISDTTDVTLELIQVILAAAPAQLAELSPEMWRAIDPDVVAVALPAVSETLTPTLLLQLEAIQLAAAGQEPEPAALPESWTAAAVAAGFSLSDTADITPQALAMLAAGAPELLADLTDETLLAFAPDTLAALPDDYLAELDPGMQQTIAVIQIVAARHELAAVAGRPAGEEDDAVAGPGRPPEMIIQGEEAADPDAPPLSGPWLTPQPDGSPSPWQTADSILNNRFAPSAAAFINMLPESPGVEDPAASISSFSPEVMQYLAENEADFVANLSPLVLELMAPETIAFLLNNYPEAFDAEVTERLRGIVEGDLVAFVPESTVTRTNGNPSVIVNIFQDGDANTVTVAHRVFDEFAQLQADYPALAIDLVFEQATFIEESIAGVSREGLLGGVFAVIVILLFLSGRVGNKYKLSWRATLVTAVSIPLSIFSSLLMMWLVPLTIGGWLQTLVEGNGGAAILFLSRLLPSEVSLNIMTLSGLTVAIGRVVDDSIVVLENSYRYIQKGETPREAALKGTREVARAIFSASATTMAVFLPLGLIGGMVGSFFLPFAMTVTYALAASFLVSITVVPALTYLLIKQEHIPEERETAMQRGYTPLLVWALRNRGITMAIATAIFVASLFLLAQLPQSFIPTIGEPTINVRVELPAGTSIMRTNEAVQEFEATAQRLAGVATVRSEIGSGGGLTDLFVGNGVRQNQAGVTITVQDQQNLTALTDEVRRAAVDLFGEDNVSVSAISVAEFGSFSLILTGNSLEDLLPLVDEVKATLAAVDVDGDGRPDIANISSNVDGLATGEESAIIRIDGRPAISFSGELETQNTLGVTGAARQAVVNLPTLPPDVVVSEGFESEQQVEGFRSMLVAILYSILIAYFIMALTFRSLVHPFTILFSLPFALVGASIALYITSSTLGISAMIGLMMLVGLVVTQGIVLMELVRQLRQQGLETYDALVEGGRTRLRPIWMTALTAILALTPLAASGEAGAIIASELARAVIGGLLVSTGLTLIVVPVVYSLFDELPARLRRQA